MTTPSTSPAARFEWKGELGRGARSRVVLARDLQGGGVLRALKVVDSTDASRLVWELEVLRSVRHPNLAAVHDLLQLREPWPSPWNFEAGTVVLVEEHVEGCAASEAATRLRDAPPERRFAWIASVGIAISRALAALHGRGLLHGDVKPANVVVGDDPQVARLVDLGLARPPGRTTSLEGTPAFLAPEAWRGERGYGTDLYALGRTLCALADAMRDRPAVQGTDAVSGDTDTAVAVPPATPFVVEARIDPEMPESLRAICLELLEPDPSRRPASASRVAGRLASILAALDPRVAVDLVGGGVEEAPTRRPRATPPRARPRRRRGGGGGGRPSARSGGGGGGVVVAPPPPPPPPALAPLPLVGRGEALRALRSAMTGGGLVELIGPSGAGRTRLVREAVHGLQAERVRAGQSVPGFVAFDGAPRALPEGDLIVLVEVRDPASVVDVR
ncbi:MAG: serine/threonine protein kinase, partial [Myxococcota bacterium]|nr:serine/threonine protein kinase [Myxococcota bacterium]